MCANVISAVLIFTLIYNATCQWHEKQVLDAVLDQVTEFFEKLKFKYETKVPDIDTVNDINYEIASYIENVIKPHHYRVKKQAAGHTKSVDLLKGFEDFLTINLGDVKDLALFPVSNGTNLLWFAAVLQTSDISLYHFDNNTFNIVNKYPQVNGVRIVTKYHGFETFLIVQTKNDGVTIYRMVPNKNSFTLWSVQYLEFSGVTYVSTWHGMNQMYLGVATPSHAFIFAWLGEHFDSVQILELNAERLLPFQSKGFMYLVATGARTTVLRFSLRSNKFVIVQKLPASRDAATFHLAEDHFLEQFLILSGRLSTVLYKESNDRFVPFQEIGPSEKVIPLIRARTLALVSLHGNSATAYQYDGWRFVRLNVKLSDTGDIHRTDFLGTTLVVVRRPNGNWTLKKPKWIQGKSHQNLMDETRSWCREATKKAQRASSTNTDRQDTVYILRGQIDQLRAKHINGGSTEALQNLTRQYKSILSRLAIDKDSLKSKKLSIHTNLRSLRAKRVQARCQPTCIINQVITEDDTSLPSNLKRLESKNHTLRFKTVKVDHVNNWKCPLPAFLIEEVIVNKSINGGSLTELQENALKVNEDQHILGKHMFSNLKATGGYVPLEIATHPVKQHMKIRKVRARTLNSTNGSFLLPLNGLSTVMTSTLIAPKVRIKQSVDARRISGAVRNQLAPLSEFLSPLVVTGEYVMENIQVLKSLQAKDFSRPRGKSLSDILNTALPLQENVPTHVEFSDVEWDNVTLQDHKNWVTRYSNKPIIISGRKYASLNVSVPNSTYKKLPIPRLETPLCAAAVIIPEIKYSTVTMDHIYVKNFESVNTFGASELHNTIFDLGSSCETSTCDLTMKRFLGKVIVNNATVTHIAGTNFKDLEKVINNWEAPNHFKGVIKASNLMVHSLEGVVRFNMPLPKIMRNMIVEENTHATTLNNVDVRSFMANAVVNQDMLSLGNITFKNGFSSNVIHTSHLPVNFTNLGANPNLHSKTITGIIQTSALNVPHIFNYPSQDTPLSYIVQGTATFSSEPFLRNVNAMNLDKLSQDVWLTNNRTFISNDIFKFKNITLGKNTALNELPHTPYYGSWKNIAHRLLSKTLTQNISVLSHFNHTRIPNINGSSNSTMTSSMPRLIDLLKNSLKRNAPQTIKSAWSFRELKVSVTLRPADSWSFHYKVFPLTEAEIARQCTSDIIERMDLSVALSDKKLSLHHKLNVAHGKFSFQNKVNGMNLTTDVIRHDSKTNIVLGKKTVTELTTRDLNALNFSSWAQNAVKDQDYKPIVIKGRKVFRTMNVTKLSVVGTVTGRRIENVLLKSGKQEIYGEKEIEGSMNASTLVVESFINDVNLTELVNHQLKKKNKSVQVLKSDITLQENLDIIGNLAVDGLYQGVELHGFYKDYQKLEQTASRGAKLAEMIEVIDTSLQNRAVYISKLETAEHTYNSSLRNFGRENEIFSNNNTLCEVKNLTFTCEGTVMMELESNTNLSNLVMAQYISVQDYRSFILVRSDNILIYTLNATDNQLQRVTDMYVPGILQASVVPMEDFFWIALQLPSEMWLLRYTVRGDYQQFVLPQSETFAISMTPKKRLMMLRSDGMWELNSLSIPRRVFKAQLAGKIETFTQDLNFYVKLTPMINNVVNETVLLKARYVGR